MSLNAFLARNGLVFSLSNIGDVVLTAPVIDELLSLYPLMQLDVVVGPKAKDLFEGQKRIETIIFDKSKGILESLRLIKQLRAKEYDVMIDLRQTFFPLFLKKKLCTPIFPTNFKGHSRFQHLNRLATAIDFKQDEIKEKSIIPQSFYGVQGDGFIVIAPAAADRIKRWPVENFIALAEILLSQGEKIVWVGSSLDQDIVCHIKKSLKMDSIDLTGKLNLRELADILCRCKYAIVHDSGPMHLASYFNIPLVVLWGPTDKVKYGPWTTHYEIVHHNTDCLRCKNIKSHHEHSCMAKISVDDALKGIDQLKAR